MPDLLLRQPSICTWPFYIDIIFLLFDNPQEALNIIHSADYSPWNAFAGRLFSAIVMVGRERNIYNWDLKVLASLSLGTRSIIELFQIPMPANILESNSQDVEDNMSRLSPGDIGISIIEDLSIFCSKINGKEHKLFSPFKIKLHKIFRNSSSQMIQVIRGLHKKSYGKNIDKHLDRKICENRLSPLVLILKLMADGHFPKAGELVDIDRIVKTFTKENWLVENITMYPIPMRNNGKYVGMGECLIINEVFENNEKKKREGAFRDEHELIKTFEHIGCKDSITVKRDLTTTEMVDAFVEFRNNLKRTAPDYMVVVIMTHGKRDVMTGSEFVMGIDMKGIPLRKIMNMFIDGHQCSSMIGKPKFFFVQACRGNKRQVPHR